MTRLSLAFDRASARDYDNAGRLHVEKCNVCTCGVSEYIGDEVPNASALGLDPYRRYKLLRPAEELSKPKTIASANGLPILSIHEPHDARSHQPQLVIGATGTDAAWRPPFVQNSLVFWPESSIRLIEEEIRRELSPGYSYDAMPEPGTYRGEHYDLWMSNVIFNHLALVDRGRQGPAVIVGDSAYGRSNQMRHFNTFRAVYLAADRAIRARRARDAEPPLENEIDEEQATPADLVEIVKEWLMDLSPEEGEQLLDDIVGLRGEWGPMAGVDARGAHWASHIGRARSADDFDRHARFTRPARAGDTPRLRGAARAGGAGDFLDALIDRRPHAGDAALRGVLPASERFKNLGTFKSLG
jgi:hypothetical protein